MRKATFVLTVVLVTAMAVSAAQRPRPLYNELFFEPSENVVTPHIAWAKPYAQGPVRALFICARDDMREVVEIAQRLQMDYRVLTIHERDEFAPGPDTRRWKLVRGSSHDEVAERLRGFLEERWDVIVLGAIKFDELPIDCRYRIFKQVSEGTGLVGCVRNADYPYLDRIMAGAKFHWHWNVWTGDSKEVENHFGEGEFENTVTSENPHSGDRCAKVFGVKAEPGVKSSPYAAYIQEIEVEPNTDYVFGAWYRTTEFRKGEPWLSVIPAKGGVNYLEPGKEWTWAQVEFNSGDAEAVNAYLFTRGVGGAVFWDDVVFKEAGTERNLMPNPGFEQPSADSVEIAQGIPVKSLPAFAKYKTREDFARGVFEVTDFGEGRLALMPGIRPRRRQMLTPAPDGPFREWTTQYDHYLALAIRTMLWGAQMEPEAEIAMSTETATLPADVPVTVRAASDLGTCRLRMELRDHTGEVFAEHSSEIDVGEGASEATVTIDSLPTGEYFADLWLLRDEKTVSFAAEAIGIQQAQRIEDIALDAQSFSGGEAVTGTATLANPREGGTLVLEVRDNHDRLEARAELPAQTGDVAFNIEPPEPLTIMHHIRAELRSGDEVLDVARISYPVNDFRPEPNQIRHVMWQGLGNDFTSPTIARVFSDWGIDTQYTGFHPLAPYNDMWHLPYATRFVDVKTDYHHDGNRAKDDHVRDPCCTDPEHRAELREDLTATAEKAAHYSTSDFSLGDENHYVIGNYDLCFSETCNADFRRWCEEQYDSIDALNAEWQTDYASFDEVMPITEDEALETERWAQWVDHRRHIDGVWAGIHDYSRDVIREVVPDARVGYEGSDTFVRSLRATDYWKLSKAMDLNNIYYRDFVSAAWQSFATEDMLLGAGWYGGYGGNRNEEYMRWFPWRALLKGSNSFWVWMGYASAGGVMAPDTSLYPWFKAACEEVNWFKRGPGLMLNTAERQHDGIALLFSASSMHVAHLTEGYPRINDILNDTVKLLHDVGLECEIVSYAELAEGAVTADEFDALLLAGAQAMSDEEVAAVESFCDAGGSVIADLRAAVRDGHGKARERGALDDLFGVESSADFAPVNGAVQPAEATGADASDTGIFTGRVADGNLKVTDGNSAYALGEAPAVVEKQHGDSLAVLMNFTLAGYSQLVDPEGKEGDFAGWEDGAAWREWFMDMLQRAGVEKQVTIEPAQPHVEVSRFHAGQARYIGILQGLPRPGMDYTNEEAELPAPTDVTVTLPMKAHVYDVRAGEYIGHRSELETQLQPGIAHLYALLPYRIDEVDIAAPNEASADERVTYAVQLSTDTGTPAPHIVRVSVLGPDGEQRAWYADNLQVEGGRAHGQFRFALDDTPGTWTIRAREIATGRTAEREIELAG